MALPPEAAGHAVESSGLGGGSAAHKPGVRRDSVVIRFAGDSGDGMQLAGMQFTAESAIAGNDIATLPDFPAEIRAPAGTLAGVSGFQLNFSSREVFTAGDEPNVLVAMNPAALKANIDDLPPNGVHNRGPRGVQRGQSQARRLHRNPLTDHSLDKYPGLPGRRDQADLACVAQHRASTIARCSAAAIMFVLGMLSWLYQRPIESTVRWLEEPLQEDARNCWTQICKVLKAGYNYGDTTEMFASSYEVPAARIAPGTLSQYYGQQRDGAGVRRCGGECGTSAVPGLVSDYASQRHPARARRLSRIFRVYTFQAEDEIAGVMLGDRRGVWRRDRDHDDLRPRDEPQGRSGRASQSRPSCRW